MLENESSEQHSDTLIGMRNLAMTYQKQGRLGEAKTLQTQLVIASGHVFGGYHSTTHLHVRSLASIGQELEEHEGGA